MISEDQPDLSASGEGQRWGAEGSRKGPFLSSAQQSSTMLHFWGGLDSVRLKLG